MAKSSPHSLFDYYQSYNRAKSSICITGGYCNGGTDAKNPLMFYKIAPIEEAFEELLQEFSFDAGFFKSSLCGKEWDGLVFVA